MNTTKLTEALRGKIDSKEKFDQILRDCDGGSIIRQDYYAADALASIAAPVIGINNALTGTTSCPHHLWWWLREAMREKFGVYQPIDTSSVLQQLMAQRHLAQQFPHISLEDPARIAVTMSTEDGLRDKQTTISLGRWLRRNLIVISDATIQQLEATHRADISAELEILRTVAGVEEAYTRMRGDSACMRYSKDHWGYDTHPSAVYASPGFGVAVVRDTDGVIVARSVVYENPDDPADKRYVRVYGDATLKRRLERNGYVMAGTAGTVMDLYPTSIEHTYILPYLDWPGGPNGGSRNKAHRAVVLREGKLHILDEAGHGTVYAALRSRDLDPSGYMGSGQSTSARITLRPLPDDLFTWQCIITGRTCDTLTDTAVLSYHNGTVGRALAWATEDWDVLTTRFGGKSSLVRFPVGTATFYAAGRTWADLPENREHNGYVKLDATLYPDRQDWISKASTTTLPDGRVVLSEDCVVLQRASRGEDGMHTTFRLKSEVSKDWVRLHKSSRFPGMAIYAEPGSQHGVTRSGAKVGRHTHDVVELFDGSLEFSRNVSQQYLVFGQGRAFMRKDATFDERIDATRVVLTKYIDTVFARLTQEGEMLTLRAQAALIERCTNMRYYPGRNEAGEFTPKSVAASEAPIHDVLSALRDYAAATPEQRGFQVSMPDNLLAPAIELLEHMADRLTRLTQLVNPLPAIPAPTTVADAEPRFVVA